MRNIASFSLAALCFTLVSVLTAAENYGIPIGMQTKVKNSKPAEERYYIYVMKSGAGYTMVEPVLARIRTKYEKHLVDSYKSSLDDWKRNLDKWTNDPRHKGEQYHWPQPQPKVVLSRSGPFNYQATRQGVKIYRDQIRKREEAQERKQQLAAEREEKAREKAEKKRKAFNDQLFGSEGPKDKKKNHKKKRLQELEDIGDE